jgi:TPR repeat protein
MKFNRIAIAKRLMFYKKYKKAKELLLLSANKNNAMAQYLLGYFYFDCRSNMTAKESEYWFKKSAKNGNADAMAQLAKNGRIKKNLFSGSNVQFT